MLKRGALIATFGSLYLATAAYLLLVKGTGGHPSPLLELVFQVFVLGCYGSLWFLLENLFCRKRPSPVQAFWHLIVGAVVFAALFIAVVTIIPGGFNAGQPIAISTVVQSALVVPVWVAFTILLLLRFRGLILHRRSKATVRSWRWWIGLLVLNAALSAIFEAFPESELEDPVRIAGAVPLLILGAINVFRASWVVRLSAGRKAQTILMAVVLMIFCAITTGDFEDRFQVGGAGEYIDPVSLLKSYSAGLHFFGKSASAFGVVYCLTSILSLAFHLPTTGDFRRREGEMAAIYSLTDLVKEVFDRDKLVRTIVTSAAKAHSASMAWLAMPDPDAGRLCTRVVATHNITPGTAEAKVNLNAFYDEAASTQETLYLDQALADRRMLARSGDGIECLLIVPLATHKQVLGVLFLARDVAHGFDREDIQAVNSFAAQAALALDNLRLFEKQVERERLARELAIARDVQKRLIPQRLPAFEHVDVAAVSVPAHEVGGDYYDFVELDEHRLAFTVSDVSGKGTSAAFYMAGMHGIFRSVTRIAPDPRDFLAHANHVLCESLERNVFITVIYGILDHKQQTITLARAGHCPAVFARGDKPAEFLRSSGLGVGLDRSARFRDTLAVEIMTMAPGDVAVFYTDGVVESRNPSGEEYGYDRLLAAVQAQRTSDAAAIHSALLAKLQQFMGRNHHYDDDMTLLVFKWHESGPTKAVLT